MRLALLALGLVGCAQTDTGLGTGNTGDDTIVTGTGRMELDKTEIVISDIELGYSKSESFTVTSVGDANLQIYEIRIVADVTDSFYFDEVDDVELAVGQTASYTVVADLNSDAPAEGELRLKTSDPDANALIVPLYAYPQGYEPPEDTGAQDTGAPEDTGPKDTGADSGA